MTTTEDEDFVRLIYAETDSPPPSAVNLDHILRDGKRRRRRRQLIVPTSATLFVVILSLAIHVVRPPADRRPSESQPAAGANSTSAPTSFDPFTLRVSAGWVPDGLLAQPPIVAPSVQQIAFWDAATQAEAALGAWVDVTLYVRGVTPWQLAPAQHATVPPPTVTETDPVAGHAAQRYTFPTTAGPTVGTNALAWEWAPNSWAVVRANIADATTQQTVERRVAESVRTDERIPILLPFTVTTPPSALHLSKVELREEPPWYSYSLEFGIDDPQRVPFPISPAQKPHDSLIVSLSRSGTNSAQKPAPNRTIGGYPAYVDFSSTTFGSVVLYRAGYEINVYVSDEGGLKLVNQDRALAIALSIVPLGAPTQRSNWTSSPLK